MSLSNTESLDTTCRIKYQPSYELINVVKENIEENKSINIFTQQVVNITEEQVSQLISHAITGFLATISQGLAYGDGQYALLSNNNVLDNSFLQGVLIRIPVTKNIQLFSQLLYKDLMVAAKEEVITSEFGKLVMKNNELTLERIKVIPPKDNSKIKRAEVNRLG